jgi:hypothetical protein
MNLSIEEQEQLYEAILNTFPSEEALEIMVKYKLKQRLNQIAFGNTYSALVFRLIDWAESQGKLDDLIKGAYESNPNNVKLKEFYDRYCNNTLGLMNIGHKILNDLELEQLYKILNQINNKLLTKICKEILQDNINDLLANYPELSGDLDLKELMEILIDKYPETNEKIPTIVEFANRLRNQVAQNLSDQLTEWIDKVSLRLNICFPTDKNSPLKTQVYQYFLLITAIRKQTHVSPKNSKLFQLQAKLLLYDFSEDKYESCGGNILKESIIECNFEEIVAKISEIVKRCYPFLEYPYIINVQLFLNSCHLGYAFDSKEIVIDQTGNKNYLGAEHPFLVSPLERFYEERHYNEFCLRWKDLKNKLGLNLANLISSLQDMASYNYQDLNELVHEWAAEEIVGLKIMGCWDNNEDIYNKLFDGVVKSGIPLVLWVRRNDLPNCQEQFNDLFSGKINNWQDLFDKVKKCRKKSYYRKQEYLGCHLGILADDPRRIPLGSPILRLCK